MPAYKYHLLKLVCEVKYIFITIFAKLPNLIEHQQISPHKIKIPVLIQYCFEKQNHRLTVAFVLVNW